MGNVSKWGFFADWLIVDVFEQTWLWVASIGFAVGCVELISRYREQPFRAIATGPAVLYVAVNVVACVACLWALEAIQPSWIYVADRPEALTRLYLVLSAGFGAVAIFRSSIFKIKTPDGDLSIGPSVVLETLLAASDRGVDRLLAASRGPRVVKVMDGISFDRAKVALPTYCFALMQNVGLQEQKAFGDQVNSLSAAQMDDKVRALNLGLALVNVVGQKVLERAVGELRDFIKGEPPVAERDMARAATLMEPIDFDKAKQILPLYCLSIFGTVPQETQTALAKQIEALGASSIPARARALTLGVAICAIVGYPVLEFCVQRLGDEIRVAPAAPAH
jgi:hypothetical protein